MKKIILYLTVALVVSATTVVALRTFDTQTSNDEGAEQSSESTAPSPISGEQKAEQKQAVSPTTLRIPKLGVSSAVESVGLDAQKRMDVPQKPENVAWYELGPRPGEVGSVVIAGHYDAPGGAPAVFYKLEQLQVGDEIIVEEDSKELVFKVTALEHFSDESFPIPLVFERTDARRLNLITCAGTYDKTAKNYSDRFVVFAVLK